MEFELLKLYKSFTESFYVINGNDTGFFKVGGIFDLQVYKI